MARTQRPGASPEPRHAPTPEGPEEIAERIQRAREGPATATRRSLARAFGLEGLSPGLQVLTMAVVLIEVALPVLGFFTDLPMSWLLTIGLALPSLLLHHFQKKRKGSALDAARGAGHRARGAKTALGGRSPRGRRN